MDHRCMCLAMFAGVGAVEGGVDPAALQGRRPHARVREAHLRLLPGTCSRDRKKNRQQTATADHSGQLAEMI